jgi:Chitobiase/beta-hexosaminidase C-terminal domain
MKRFLPLVSLAFIACQNDTILTVAPRDHVALAPRLMDAQGAMPAVVQNVHILLTVGKPGTTGYMVKDTTVSWESKSLSLAVPVGQRYTLLMQGRNQDDPDSCWRWSGLKSDSIGVTDEVVQADTLFISNISAPTLTAIGGSYSGSVEVNAKGPQGAVLRYTIDGTNPGPKSTALTSPVILKSTSWFRVRSFVTQADGTVLCSPASEAKYTIVAGSLPAAPTVTPDGGTFTRPTNIAITAPSGTMAYVSYDGYTFLPISGDSLKVDRTETLFLRSQATALESAVRVVNFVVDLDSNTTGASVTQAVTFGLPGGTYRSSQLVPLACATNGAQIRYSFATAPTSGDWIDYTTPILIDQTNRLVTLSVQAMSSGRSISPITKMAYFLQQ